MRATNIKTTRQVVEDYQRLFVNRRAYTMQSLRPHPESGRHYYFRPNKKGTDLPAMLTDQTIRGHLEGKITIGLYAINPSTQRCKSVAIDADYRNAMEDLLKLQYHLSQDGMQPALGLKGGQPSDCPSKCRTPNNSGKLPSLAPAPRSQDTRLFTRRTIHRFDAALKP